MLDCRNRGWLGLLLLSLSAQTAPTQAQAQIEDQAREDDSIVVTGSRTGLETRQIGSSITVVGGERIQGDQAVLVKDVLQDVPGVQIGNDRPGAVTGVSLRGSDNDQVLVLLDGHELGDPSNISTEYYFDLKTLGAVASNHRLSRLERWLFSGLHSLDFGFWYGRRPFWDIGMILLSLGALATSAIGVVIGYRRLSGQARREQSAAAG